MLAFMVLSVVYDRHSETKNWDECRIRRLGSIALEGRAEMK
jgi:hypothetical protein